MFKELGQLAGLMKAMPQLGKIREEMERMQERMTQIIAEGDAGGGMVKVKANGKMEVVACTVSDEIMRLNDREMLEDLIVAAVNQALAKVRQQAADEAGKVASGLGLPPGLSLPGMS